MRADCVGLGQIPGPCLVAVGKAHQRADRADLDAVAALVATRKAALEAGDGRIHAFLDSAQGHSANHFLAHPDAALALDAAVDIHDDDRAETDVLGVEHALGIAEPAFAGSICHHQVLKLAFAALVADRAVEGVVGEKHVEHGRTRFVDQRRVCSYHHAVGNRGGTGRLQPPQPLDLHQAHAARRQRWQPLQIAEGRDIDAQTLGSLQHRGARFQFQCLFVDRDLNHGFLAVRRPRAPQ